MPRAATKTKAVAVLSAATWEVVRAGLATHPTNSGVVHIPVMVFLVLYSPFRLANTPWPREAVFFQALFCFVFQLRGPLRWVPGM